MICCHECLRSELVVVCIIHRSVIYVVIWLLSWVLRKFSITQVNVIGVALVQREAVKSMLAKGIDDGHVVILSRYQTSSLCQVSQS